MTQRISFGFYFRVVVEDVAATERQEKDCLTGEELFQEGQIQVASRKTLGFEKEFCSGEDVVACEEVFGKTFVAEEDSGEMGGEKDVAFKDQVGLREKGEEDFL